MKAFVSTWKLIFMVFFGLNKLGKHVSRGDGQFYGGTLSNYIERHPDGTIKVTVQLISGWVLGKGPCGPGCGKGDIGRSTRSSRQQILNSNPGSLGNFTSDYINRFTKQTETKDLTTVVSRSNNETVIWVDEYEKFEQEILYFNLELQSAQDRLVIKYEGNSWRKISGLQLEHSRRWHFQTTILTAIRNDTGKPNSNPQALIKPFYRVKLGKVSEIRIPVIDSEGDFIRCYLASFIEAGDISLQPPPNVFVNENCSVYVNASESKNFTDDTWIAVPVSIRDFNKHDIMYGQDFLHAVSYSLSTVPVQFTVQVLANLLTPVFVEPTVESNHVFTLYPDTTWRIEVYVKATENCAIDELIVRIGLRKENFMLSALQDDQRRPRVKHATISWTPSDNDSGQHLACVSAVDNTGVSSAEQRCFILDILAGAFHYRTNISLDRPYFVNIPSPNETVSCEVQKTCVVAIHIKSSLEVTDVLVTASFLDKYQLGPIQRVIHNGEQLYKVDLSFEHFMPGKEYICLTAVDKNRKQSENVCIHSLILPPDSCLSSPCKNSGKCEMDINTGAFRCLCLHQFTGKRCETKMNACDFMPCVGGKCINIPMYTLYIQGFFCYCPVGLTGSRCEFNINDCSRDRCNGRGICLDKVNDYNCLCFDRFNGTHCEQDKCPTAIVGAAVCRKDGCSLDSCYGRRGVCQDGGKCLCSSGFTDPNCGRRKCDRAGIVGMGKITTPSLNDGSKIVCYTDGDFVLLCNIRIYLTLQSVNCSVTVDANEDIRDIITVEAVKKSSDIPGMSTLYTADVTISGRVKSMKSYYVCVTALTRAMKTSACYELSLMPDPRNVRDTLSYMNSNATVKFVQPTLEDGSRILCRQGETCRVLMYTSFASNRLSCKAINTSLALNTSSIGSCGNFDKDNDEEDPDTVARSKDPCCVDVVSASGVTVFPAHPRGPSCVSEAAFSFVSEGEKDICFMSALTDSQQLCYKVGVYNYSSDPCSSSPCLNNGHCFHTDHQNYTCLCPDHYVGNRCERGPCQIVDNNCQNGAYCQTNAGVNTCICRAGFSGVTCSRGTSGVNRNFEEFKDTAIPTTVPCRIYQQCSMTLFLAGTPGYIPTVSYGFVDRTLFLYNITTTERPSFQNSYQTDIHFKTSSIGLKYLCIQIKDHNGVNKDEICLKVSVTSDVLTTYGVKDRPHFVDPSLSNAAELECMVENPCHIIYHVTSGQGNENKCITYNIQSQDAFVGYHLFSSCDDCKVGIKGYSNCSIDISLVNYIGDVGAKRHLCLTLGLKGSTDTGETRCFTINLTDQNTVIMKGCHALECRNGGFCDGHITTGPLCFCREGFSGTNCDKVAEMSVISSSQLLSFIGDFAIPVDIKCTVNQACPIPIYVFSKSTSVPKVLFGYVDAGINAEKPVLKLSRFFNTIFEGNATVYSNRSGVYKVCIQTSITRKTEDEICVSIEISTVAEKNDLLRPYFLPPTIPKESTVLCEINMTCHFHLHFTKGDAFGSPGECPTVKDTSPVRLPVHVFDSILESDECVSGISYLPQTVGARHILCVQIILPGHQGENRCFTIKSVINMSLEVISPCRAKSCANGGQCIANISVTPVNIQCVCQSGKSGDSCNSGETCDKTCLNGGSCGNGICHCRTGYSGDYCERVLDPCSSNPCVRGTCFHHIRQYYCMCPSGFTGDKCEININECFSQPCLNAGICVDNVGSFTCNCSSGFDGKLCEKDIDACLSLPCLNGGFCEDSIDKFFCQCRTGFEGDRCQNVVDPCMTNPCARGSCFSHQSQFLCRCPSGFTGRLCDESIYLSLNGPVETFLKVQHEGELLLNCSVSGVHPPKFHWTKLRACDTEVEKNKASVFHLSHVSFGSAGTYTCTASDGFSRNVTSYFHVEITTTSDQELCNFDDGGLCGWTQPTNDSFDWTIQNGPTQSDGTGPNADHTKGTSTGKYLYIESSSPRSFGEYADLLSPILPANQTMCFEFWYYMFGDGTGRLFVFLQDICLKKETQLFKLTGDQGQRWNRAAVTVTDKSVPNDYRVVVRADVGQTFHGDTAIDDPTTSRGICKGTQGASIVG